MELASKYNPADVEGKWYQYWLDNKLFSSKPDGRQPYTVVIPPPNVTGVLHMGHMLNNTIQDILIRRARMQGKNACWVPGTDHASIATEAKVVNRLAQQGIKKTDLTREDFLKHAWEWKEEHGGIILKQLRKLGASCDWDRTAFTMDELRSESVIKVFVDLYNKGLIYRGVRMVNWDPKALTALSDEEVIYKEEHSKLYYLRYKVEGDPEGFFEPLLILLIVVVNAIMGVMQESRAEKALEALKSMSAPHARVLRDKAESIIDASELVPGDIIRLEAGDFVPADARLLQSVSLKSEESALTGESVPAEKDAGACPKADAPIGDRSNMVFSGCSITYGTAVAVVTATGMDTEMGKIANLLEGADDGQTPLQKRLAQLGKYLGILALAACAIIFVVGLANGLEVMEIFMTSVSLAVSAIPEGLPVIVTIVLLKDA